MEHFFSCWLLLFVLLLLVFCGKSLQEATSQGDIVIGGVFPIHESVDTKGQCDRFSASRLAQSLVMVHAIEEVNRSGELGNITLGYHIVDSCGDVTTALRNILTFMKMSRNSNIDCKRQPTPPVMAVIGDYYSEISVAVTRQLNLEEIPLISYGSTSGLLSDKARFPSFLRTVPEDDHQARAIIKILKDQNWNWVGILTTDGEYGRYALERLRHHAEIHDICFAYTKLLPEFLGDNKLKDSIRETVNSIIENDNVPIIVSFAKSDHMANIFDMVLMNPKGKNKVWIASDNWSQSVNCLNTTRWRLTDVGTVFGITLKSGKKSRFERFLRNITEHPDLFKINSFLNDYLGSKNDSVNASNTSVQSKMVELIRMTHPFAVFSIELAVKAIAQTVKDLCINKECNLTTLNPGEFRDVLKHTNFFLDGKNYSFDEHGNLNSGYDVIQWRSFSQIDVSLVGQYDITKKNMTFNSNSNSLMDQIKEVKSKCSTCHPGQMKIMTRNILPVCCYECKMCPMNEFSNTTDATRCYKCNKHTEYSEEGSSSCMKRQDLYLNWGDRFHIVLLAFAALGALLTIIVSIIFIAYWNTPVVRSAVGPICILLLFSLLCTFGSVPLFGDMPSEEKCKARQVFFGLSFTLSVSCILVRSFKIILAFEFDPVTKEVLQKLYKPYIIIALCLGGQVVICAVWLIHNAPKKASTPYEKHLLWYCKENSYPMFGAMLAYIGLLGIICFALAFKGRKLPQYYNDAKFITFSMLIYFISWIIFGPVYKNVEDKYQPAIEMAVIVISAYGILYCLFFTRCYVILLKQEQNTEAAFRRDLRQFSEGRGGDMEGNHLDGIQNPAFFSESLSSPESVRPITDGQPSPDTTVEPIAPSPISDVQPVSPTNEPNFEKKQLQRYCSLPIWVHK